MGVIDRVLSNFGYTRLTNGTHRYEVKKNNASYGDAELMELALNNPVTYACIEIRAKLLSQVEFYMKNDNGDMSQDNDIIKLLKNPNTFQSKEDFLKQYEWFKSTYGWVYQKPYGAVGLKASSLFNLNPAFIDFEDTFVSPIAWTESDVKEFNAQKFEYDDPNSKPKDIEFGDILPFYDTGNGIDTTEYQNNPLISPSRMSAILKSIHNINEALDAENVMIGTNGREIFSGGSERGFNLGAALPMEKDDKDSIESNLINDYGMTALKRRSIATNQKVDWQSLHIKLKDLGLHESISNNANLVRETFEVPNELYKAFQTGSTYENQKESLISFVQSTIQPIADDLAHTYNQYFGLENEKIVASFEHLPVMQHTEDKKAEKVLKISTAFQRLIAGGLSTDEATNFLELQGVKFNNE